MRINDTQWICCTPDLSLSVFDLTQAQNLGWTRTPHYQYRPVPHINQEQFDTFRIQALNIAKQFLLTDDYFLEPKITAETTSSTCIDSDSSSSCSSLSENENDIGVLDIHRKLLGEHILLPRAENVFNSRIRVHINHESARLGQGEEPGIVINAIAASNISTIHNALMGSGSLGPRFNNIQNAVQPEESRSLAPRFTPAAVSLAPTFENIPSAIQPINDASSSSASDSGASEVQRVSLAPRYIELSSDSSSSSESSDSESEDEQEQESLAPRFTNIQQRNNNHFEFVDCTTSTNTVNTSIGAFAPPPPVWDRSRSVNQNNVNLKRKFEVAFQQKKVNTGVPVLVETEGMVTPHRNIVTRGYEPGYGPVGEFADWSRIMRREVTNIFLNQRITFFENVRFS